MASPPTIPLSEREIGAGTDPETGWPVLLLEGLGAYGIDLPDQRHLIAPDVAVKLGATLLAAGAPDVLARLLAVFGASTHGVAASDFEADHATHREAFEAIVRVADDQKLTTSERTARMRALADAALRKGRP